MKTWKSPDVVKNRAVVKNLLTGSICHRDMDFVRSPGVGGGGIRGAKDMRLLSLFVSEFVRTSREVPRLFLYRHGIIEI